MEQVYPKFIPDSKDKEILFSRAIKAGKRIYYLDVKKNKKEELFLTITESKKIVTGTEQDTQVVYEKHKIFLYQEDFDKFCTGLEEVFDYIKEKTPTPHTEEEVIDGLNFKIDEFE